MDKAKRGYSFSARVGFTLYVLVCLVVFIYMRFPYDMLKDRLEQALSMALTADVSVGHMSAHLPLGLAADGLDINGVPVATRLTFRPELTPLLSGRLGVDVSARLVSGSLDGSVQTPLSDIGGSVELIVDADSVDPSSFSKFLPPHIQPKGSISGHAEIEGDPESMERIQGTVTMVWKDGSIPLDIPVLPMDALGFRTLQVDAHMDKGILTIKRAELNGDMSATVNGAIRLRDVLERSRLNLTGEVSVPENMKSMLGIRGDNASGGIKFSLRGTVGSPRFRVLSR